MTPSQLIDKQLADIHDWRSERLSWFRELVHKSSPELNEDFKWGVGVFSYAGKPVLAFSAFKDHTKFNFFQGARLSDSHSLFNSGLDSKLHRSINLGQNDNINQDFVVDLIFQAVLFAKG